MSRASEPAVALRRQNLIAAVSAITVFGFALGMLFPLLSLIMEKAGIPADLIGLNTSMQPLGILLSGFVVPVLVHRYGAKRTCIGAAVAAGAIIISYPFTPIVWGWFVIRVLHGLAVSILFAVSEAWIVQAASPAWRSRVMAIYSSVLATSFGLGPGVIYFAGIDGVLPFVVGAVVLLAAALPMLWVHDEDEEAGEGAGAVPFLGMVRKAPVLLIAVGVFAVFDAACLGLLSVYGVRKGLPLDEAALTISVFAFGNIFLQYPIGMLADRVPRRTVMAGCALATAIGAALIPASVGTPWFWLLVLLLGPTSSGIYTVALAEMGDRFSGAELMAATSAMSTMWGLGAIVGAVVAGWAFDSFGPDGFPYSMAIALGLFLVLMLWRLRNPRTG